MRMATLLLLLSATLFSCGGRQEQQEVTEMESDTSVVESGNNGAFVSETTAVAKAETPKFEVVTFQNDSPVGGWGFDIYVDGRRYIHQPTVPVVAGVSGFETMEQSERAGGMMVTKIKEGRMPPALDRRDLELLGLKLP